MWSHVKDEDKESLIDRVNELNRRAAWLNANISSSREILGDSAERFNSFNSNKKRLEDVLSARQRAIDDLNNYTPSKSYKTKRILTPIAAGLALGAIRGGLGAIGGYVGTTLSARKKIERRDEDAEKRRNKNSPKQ